MESRTNLYQQRGLIQLLNWSLLCLSRHLRTTTSLYSIPKWCSGMKELHDSWYGLSYVSLQECFWNEAFSLDVYIQNLTPTKFSTLSGLQYEHISISSRSVVRRWTWSPKCGFCAEPEGFLIHNLDARVCGNPWFLFSETFCNTTNNKSTISFQWKQMSSCLICASSPSSQLPIVDASSSLASDD